MMMVIANAQSDNFFRSSGNDGYENREGEMPGFGFDHFTGNDQNGGTSPVGSGLIILGALGAGYAVARRKK